MRRTERMERSQQDMHTGIRQHSQSARRPERAFWRKCRLRLICGIIICILSFGGGMFLYFHGGNIVVNTTKYVAGAVLAGSGGYLIKWAWEHKNVSRAKVLIRKTVKSIGTWCLVIAFISSVIIFVPCYAKSEALKVTTTENKEEQKEKQKAKEEVKRNSEPFSWENDLYIDDLSKYYTGNIEENDREKYVIQLIREDLSAQVGEWNGKGDEAAYGVAVETARQYYEKYLEAVNNGDYPEVQKTLLGHSIDAREDAKDNKKTALNQEKLGQSREEYLLIEKRMENDEWYSGYKDVLKDYIIGLKCSIRENDGEKREELWEKIIRVYGEMGEIQEDAEYMRGILAGLDIADYEEWGEDDVS